MIRDHAAAVQARLEADSFLTGRVYEGIVNDRPDRYCSFFLNSGLRTGDRLAGPDVVGDFTLTVHSVGSIPEQAQFIAEHVLAQLLNFTLTVDGRQCSLLRHIASIPLTMDDSVSPVIYYAVDEFSFTSDPT